MEAIFAGLSGAPPTEGSWTVSNLSTPSCPCHVSIVTSLYSIDSQEPGSRGLEISLATILMIMMQLGNDSIRNGILTASLYIDHPCRLKANKDKTMHNSIHAWARANSLSTQPPIPEKTADESFCSFERYHLRSRLITILY